MNSILRETWYKPKNNEKEKEKRNEKIKKNRLTKNEERNMIYILHGEMEGLKIEMKCGLVFRSCKERHSRFLRSDLDLTEVEP